MAKYFSLHNWAPKTQPNIVISDNQFLISCGIIQPIGLATVDPIIKNIRIGEIPIVANKIKIKTININSRNFFYFYTETLSFAASNPHLSYPATLQDIIIGISDSSLEFSYLENKDINEYNKLNKYLLPLYKFDLPSHMPNKVDINFIYTFSSPRKYLNIAIYNEIFSNEDCTEIINELQKETGNANIINIDFYTIYTILITGEIL